MATASSSANAPSGCCCYYLLLLLVVLLLPACARCRSPDEGTSFAFVFDRNRTLGEEIALRGGAEIRGSVVLLGGPGRMVSRRPVRFFGARPGFSAYFSFISSPSRGDGPAFFLTPAVVSSKARGTTPSPAAAIQVEFAGGMDRKGGNFSESFIRIRVGDQDLIRSKDLSGVLDGSREGKKLHTWIDYDGDTKRMQVRLSESRESRPRNATMSYQIDLSDVLWREAMLVGMSSSNASSPPRSCSIYGWSFTTRRGTPYLMHSEPLDPESSLVAVRPLQSGTSPDDRPGKGGGGGRRRSSYPWDTIAGLMLAAACGALVTFLVMFVWLTATARRPVAFVHPVADVVYDKIVVVGKTGKVEENLNKVVGSVSN